MLVLATLSACGGQAATWEGDPALYGARLEVVDPRDWTQRADFTGRLRKVIQESSARWGMDPSALAGWRIVFRSGGSGGLSCGSGIAHVDGCTDEQQRTITVSVDGWYCVEESPLAHEIGHVALLQSEDGDPAHHDARWWDDAAWGRLWDEMAGGLPSPDGPVAKCFLAGSYPRVQRWTGLGH